MKSTDIKLETSDEINAELQSFFDDPEGDHKITPLGSMASESEEEQKAIKRPSLASHHRRHHHHHHHHSHSSSEEHSSSEHRHSSRRHRSIRRRSSRKDQYIGSSEFIGQAETVEIDRDVLERLHEEHQNESRNEETTVIGETGRPEAEQTPVSSKAALPEAEQTKAAREAAGEQTTADEAAGNVSNDTRDGKEPVISGPENDNSAPAEEIQKSAPDQRLAATILAARAAKPKATRKASSIKSIGSRQRRKKARAVTIAVGILIVLAALLLGFIIALLYMRSHGQATMTPNPDDVEIVMSEDNIPKDVEKIEDDGKTVTYKGVKYRWNEKLSTVLILGTDRTLEQQESGMTMAGKNGQADTIMLGVIDNANKKISFININRDTFVPVSEYTSDGNYAGEKKMQICLSYAYGKDDETSCRYTAEAVSKYLYGMPIDYYTRLSYDAIQVLNDSVGGVTLTVVEDMTAVDPFLKKGATVTLAGNQAMVYVRWRDKSIVNTNENRISRQKQYLQTFMKRAMEVTRADLTFPLGVYTNVKPYMTTNVTPSQVTYITSKTIEYGLSDDAIRSIPGESVVGSDDHVEFHPDQTALYELVLNTFYNKVDS